MDKSNYYCILAGVRDKVSGTIMHIGHCTTLGEFTRDTLPNFAKIKPLNDLEIVELGEINAFTGTIKPIEKVKNYDWNTLYNFQVSGKAVEDVKETVKETDKE